MNDYIYYSGCSVKTNARHYEESILPVFEKLGVHLEEMDDWNCCGATATPSVDSAKAVALNGRNLAIAEKAGKDILAPCAACYLALKKANDFLASAEPEADRILAELKKVDLNYTGSIKVKHPVEILNREIGLERIREEVRRPLGGLRIAGYYGCQVVRPFSDFDDPDYPESMDDLMRTIGAEPVEYNAKTRCCGGALTANLDDLGANLNHILLKEAEKKKADAIVTLCPLCLFNLEIAQDQVRKKYKTEYGIPILFFSQLMGWAFGFSKEEMGFSRSLVPIRPFLDKIEEGGTHVA
ncbi:MAG: CoB--CoM heterodisulfide reductase iron-sulfur subunit B family protein [Candidatus Aminicenantes bacterium]